MGPYDPRDARDIEVKAYYQWVPFMLFLQSIMFYIPHVIYKNFEGGKIRVRTEVREGARRKLAHLRNICSANILCADLESAEAWHRLWPWQVAPSKLFQNKGILQWLSVIVLYNEFNSATSGNYYFVQKILEGLHHWIEMGGKDKENTWDKREEAEDRLARYIVETKGSHVSWAYGVMLAQFLYLVNVVGQIFFTDCFLGWEFTKYGVRALSFIEADVSAQKILRPIP